MPKIILNTAKSIANDATRPGVLVFNDSGTELEVPSRGLTKPVADEWVRTGQASRKAQPPAAKPIQTTSARARSKPKAAPVASPPATDPAKP